MFKKIAQWIRTRQERRLRERIIFALIARGGSGGIYSACDQSCAYIMDGVIPDCKKTYIVQDSKE